MTVLRLSLQGDPVPKQRPRLGANGNVYTPRATADAEAAIGWAFRAAYPGWEPFAVPVAVELVFRCAPVERWPDGRFKRGLPDVDNLAKTVFDALNTLAFADDALIEWLTVGVVRDSADPGTEVSIRALRWRIGC